MRAELLSKADIEAVIPHADGMCLLEKVVSYSQDEIICQTQSHLDESNPLKTDGQLSKMHLIEYGAQAIAIHGGLMERDSSNTEADDEPRVGYIAMVKSVKWGDFNPYTPFLEIKAIPLVADEMTKLYEFDVCDAEQHSVCSGRVMVVHPDLES